MFSNRREFLLAHGSGFGFLALADLLGRDARSAESDRPRGPAPTARSVIQLFMNGGPSHLDLFDPKPELQKRDGQPFPGSTRPDVFFGAPGPLLASPFRFARHGGSGQWVSELFPETARIVDRLAIIRSMRADSNNHAPALFQMNTGRTLPGDPSLGAWTTYGLGSSNRNLPGFVVLGDAVGGPIGGGANWGSGYLPGSHAGTPFRSEGAPILDLGSPISPKSRAFLNRLNQEHGDDHPNESELTTRIRNLELAHRMQAEAPEAVDLSRETDETKRLYGMDDPVAASHGRRFLLARRLIERGVRFVQIYSGGGAFEDNWDAHYDLAKNHRKRCAETDKPVAGLILDLERRGLLDSTLVLWGGEFGRMPVSQSRIGRDHNPRGFTCWMAGGGVRPGVSVGATDEFGHEAVEDPVHVNDWHATILHLLGIDHEQLTFLHEGRPKRLTDTAGRVVGAVLKSAPTPRGG